ncbi:DDE-type integrase/transposase/recombinase [Microbacterium luteolum]|uniref:DDE-type integrase/transposase/recombinase n=1 Tax=Microbacterium luteolum TaxID=69367 RepID=A0ABY7XTJ6_MICLT|nr:DDE-type integrase/transposase/recombinase [Microbacterium luteolum]WDM44359.1 DDE-type integrase/transposase/recombinase [Microbacterium luteolum]
MKLRLGDVLLWDDVPLEVVAIDSKVVHLRAVDDGFLRKVLIDELYRSTEIQWPEAFRKPRLSELAVLDGLSAEKRRIVDAWLPMLQRLDQASRSSASGRSKRTEDIVHEICGDLQAVGILTSGRTVWRKLDAYRERGIFGLLDGRSTPSPRNDKRDPRILEVISEVCASATNEATGTFSRLAKRVVWILHDRYPDDPTLVVPTEKSIARWIAEMPASKHLTGSAKTRRSLANRPDREYEQHGEWAPGDHVQIDTTPLDLQVRLDDGKLARAELTIMLDVATRSIISAVVCLDGTTTEMLALVLARALVPYGLRPPGTHETRELVASAWAAAGRIPEEELDDFRRRQPYIRPSTITTDNGKIFVSKAFREACERLEISIINSAVYTPTDKSHVERTFKTIAAQFAQHFRTYTGRNVEHRGREVVAEFAPTLVQLQELLDDWISIWWQNRPHSGLRDPIRPARKLTPNEMFEHYRRIMPEVHVPFGADDYIRLLPAETRTLQAYGFTIGHRIYSSRRLGEIRKSIDRDGGRQWRIRRDRFNLFTVWLEHDDELVPLTWRTTVGRTPFGEDLRRSIRSSDSGQQDDSRASELALLLQEGLWKGRYGEPEPIDLDDAGADPNAVEGEPDEPELYRRTGAIQYLGGTVDDEDLWEAAGGFSGISGDDMKGRIDD